MKLSLFVSSLIAFMLIACGDKDPSQETVAICNNYKNYASVTFEVSGDLSETVEKSAKKALTRSCYKKTDSSNSNLRIKINATQTSNSELGFIKDKYENSLKVAIIAIMLVPNLDGGLTTITRKQNATLNLKSEPIAGIGDNAKLSTKDISLFIERNVAKALSELFVDIP